MMRLVLLLSVAVLLAGCSDKQAREYAAELAKVLSSYQKQTAAKLADEQKRYVAEAKQVVRETDVLMFDTLRMNRNQAASSVVFQDLVSGRTGPEQVLRTLVPQYAQSDFEKTKALFDRADDAYLDHLRRMNDLRMEQVKIGALQDALEGLAKKPNFGDLAKNYTTFASELGSALAVEACQNAADSIEALNARSGKIQEELAKAPSEEQSAIKERLDSVKADIAVRTKIRDATGKFRSGKCEN